MNFESVIFVLVGTTHSGNIGAAARAMKTMGFHQLRLVDCCPHRTADAISRASGANSIVEQAEVFDTLEPAIADCHHVYGTSARIRHLSVPLVSAENAATEIAQALALVGPSMVGPSSEEAATSVRPDASVGPAAKAAALHKMKIAIVFGRERSGLSNEELDRCTRLLNIPVNPEFSSLNLGSAVQVVAYEISKALSRAEHSSEPQVELAVQDDSGNESEQITERSAPANSQTMAQFFEHLERTLLTVGFLDPANPRLLMRRLRGYFERNRPNMTEISILRGILSASEKPRTHHAQTRKDNS